MSEIDVPAARPLDMSIYGNEPPKSLLKLSESKRKQYEELDTRYKNLQKSARSIQQGENLQYMEENPMTISEELLRFYAGAGGLNLEETALERIFGNTQAVPALLPDERIKERIVMDLRSKVLADKSNRKYGPVGERTLRNFGAAMDFETTTNDKYSYQQSLAEKRREEGLNLFLFSSRDNLY